MTEANQVLWRGVRNVSPLTNLHTAQGVFETSVDGVTRTQINKSVEIDDTTGVIHTVTGGKTFYLVAATCSAGSGAAKVTHLIIRNDSDVEQFTIFDFATAAAGSLASAVCFPTPILITAAWDIVLITTNDHAAGFITGWEQ